MKKITTILFLSLMMFSGFSNVQAQETRFLNPSEITNTSKDNDNANSAPTTNPRPVQTPGPVHTTTSTTTTSYGR